MRLCLAGTFPSEKIVRKNRPEYVPRLLIRKHEIVQ